MIALWVVVAASWIANIVKLVSMLGGDITLLAVLRIIGIFAPPLGCVLGFVSN
jgi:hypothetical protein